MSSVSEDLRKIMNLDPWADPFVETFNSAYHSLEAIRGAINALEYGIFGYGIVSGPHEVEIADKADFEVELLNPGGAIVPAGSITPGVYYISRIRNGVKQQVHPDPGDPDVAAVAADGKVVLDTPYEFVSGTDAPPVYYWEPGDLVEVKFTGIKTTIDSTETFFPDMVLQGRITRDEEIEDILEYTIGVGNTLKDAIEDNGDSIYNRLGDPTGETLTSLTAKFGNPTLTFNDHIEVSATEKLKDFIAKTGGTPVGLAKSIIDAIGHDGLADKDTGLMAQLQDYVVDDAASIYNRLGDPTGETLTSLTAKFGNPTLTFNDHIEVSATEKLKDFIAKTGGTPVGLAKSIIDAIGHDGLADKDTGLMAQLQDYVVDDAASIYNRLGDPTGETLTSLTAKFGNPTLTFNDHIEVSATEKLKDFIAKTGGTPVGLAKSIIDAIGHDGLADKDTGLMAQLQDYVVDDAASIYNRLGDPTGETLTSLTAKFGNPTLTFNDHIEVSATEKLKDFIAKTGGTVLPASSSLYGVLGGFDETNNLKDLLGAFTLVNNLKAILGAFTNVNNLRAILGTSFTPTVNLYDLLGGYTNAAGNTLKSHVDTLRNAAIGPTAQPGVLSRSIADYIRGIGIDTASDGFDSSTVGADEDGSIFERLEDVKDNLAKIPQRTTIKEYLLGAAVALTGDPTVSTEAGTPTDSDTFVSVWHKDFDTKAGTVLSIFAALHWAVKCSAGVGPSEAKWQIATGSFALPGAWVDLTDAIQSVGVVDVDGDRSGSIELITTVPFVIQLVARNASAVGGENAVTTIKSNSYTDYSYKG